MSKSTFFCNSFIDQVTYNLQFRTFFCDWYFFESIQKSHENWLPQFKIGGNFSSSHDLNYPSWVLNILSICVIDVFWLVFVDLLFLYENGSASNCFTGRYVLKYNNSHSIFEFRKELIVSLNKVDLIMNILSFDFVLFEV